MTLHAGREGFGSGDGIRVRSCGGPIDVEHAPRRLGRALVVVPTLSRLRSPSARRPRETRRNTKDLEDEANHDQLVFRDSCGCNPILRNPSQSRASGSRQYPQTVPDGQAGLGQDACTHEFVGPSSPERLYRNAMCLQDFFSPAFRVGTSGSSQGSTSISFRSCGSITTSIP